MSKIDKIFAIETKDSRGKPTISVTVTSGKATGNFSVPSGASTGAHEACELRDPDGGVKKAIYNINKVIAPALVGKSVFSQKLLDHIMIKLDGTPQKNNLGGNAMIGVSIAIAKAAADVHNTEVYRYLRKLTKIKSSRIVPLVYMNLINGGKHAHNDLAFQEYHIVPMTSDVKQAIQIGFKIQDSIEDMIARDLQIDEIDIGDEGGFAPKLPNVRKPLEYLQHAINEHPLGCEVRLALDVAASSFYEEGKGILGSGKYLVDGRKISKEELTDIYRNLIKEFNILSIEDPYDEEAFEDFKKLKNESKIHIVGDDLTVTNIELVEKAKKKNSINTMIIKPNQIGTLSETLDTMKYARENGIDLIVSHRSGETDDDFIADLAYAFGCFGIKAGSPRKHERMIKYKRLIQISQK